MKMKLAVAILMIENMKLFIIGLKRENFYSVNTNVKLSQMETYSKGSMSLLACTGKCLSLEEKCCEVTYNEFTNECRIGNNSCCNYSTEFSYGSFVLERVRIFRDSVQPLVVSNGINLGDWTEPEYCTKGQYAIGYKIWVEENDDDFTGANSIQLLCGSANGQACGDTAESSKGRWMDLYSEKNCPRKTFLESFNLQSEAQIGESIDYSGPNWIKFQCRDLHTPTKMVKIEASQTKLTHLRGAYGYWSGSCPLGTAICGIQTRILEFQGYYSDDLGLTDVKFFCC